MDDKLNNEQLDEMTNKYLDLYEKCLNAENAAASHKYHGQRMMKALQEWIRWGDAQLIDEQKLQELLFISKVACNKEVDWNGELKSFFNE
jgi:hypothetical protein